MIDVSDDGADQCRAENTITVGKMAAEDVLGNHGVVLQATVLCAHPDDTSPPSLHMAVVWKRRAPDTLARA